MGLGLGFVFVFVFGLGLGLGLGLVAAIAPRSPLSVVAMASHRPRSPLSFSSRVCAELSVSSACLRLTCGGRGETEGR